VSPWKSDVEGHQGCGGFTVMLSLFRSGGGRDRVVRSGSSAFYAGGIAEGYVGKSAPWFILAIMLSSYAVRAIYIESCSMFVRGGVYRVVHEHGRAPGQVFGLRSDVRLRAHGPDQRRYRGFVPRGLSTTARNSPAIHTSGLSRNICGNFAIAVTFILAQERHRHSRIQPKALRIMQLTTLMVVILIGWCLATYGGARFFASAAADVATFIRPRLDRRPGWLRGTVWPSFRWSQFSLAWDIIARHERRGKLAQVNREIASPNSRI